MKVVRVKFLVFLFLGICVAASAKGGSHGLWVDGFGAGYLNTNQVKKLVQDCRDNNFNTVYVQMRRRGDAFYIAKAPVLEPHAAGLAPDFDALAEIVKECHRSTPRIEVHCWLCSHFIWSSPKAPADSNHLYNRRPDWLTQDSEGSTSIGNGYFLDPGNPGASQWLHDIATNIVSRYDIDGLHWDYCRYPGLDSGYNPAAIKRYNQELGVEGKPTKQDAQFREWRRRQVTDFIRWTTADMLQIKTQLVVSASVFSDLTDSSDYRFADWVSWLNEGILDAVMPMDFSADNQRVFLPRAAFALKNQGCRVVYLGQAAYVNSVENTLFQLKQARQMGFGGTVLYSYRSFVANRGSSVSAPGSVEPGGITVDNAAATTTGSWWHAQYGAHQGPDYLCSVDRSGDSQAQFVPHLRIPGFYDVYEWHVAGANRSTEVPFEIVHSDGTNVVKVNQQLNGSEWNYLGRYAFETNLASVRIPAAAGSAGQVVIADALRFAYVTTNDTTVPRRSTIEEVQAAAGATRGNAPELDRDKFFARLKAEYQPTWVDAPKLPWKTQPKNGLIKGCVTGEGKKPIYNAVIGAEKLAGKDQKTEPHGAYAFFEVPPGEYTLTATAKGYQPATTKVQVQPGAIIQADFSLRR